MDHDTAAASGRAWLAARPHIESVRVAVTDLNGTLRGKRLPRARAAKALEGTARLPLSVCALDIWGADFADNARVFEEGDADGLCVPTERGLIEMPWLGEGAALLPAWFTDETGAPWPADPRRALASAVARLAAMGLTAVVGTELEFYLVANGPGLQPATSPVTGRPMEADSALSIDDLDEFEPVLADIYEACAACDVPAETGISEAGGGQFEINLETADPLRAADDALVFKRIVKGVARRHGMAATFMAKPWLERNGSGFHVHVSLWDGARNIFDDGGPRGTDRLGHAVAGCLAAMGPDALVFLPHLNSFRRIDPGSHAPVAPTWGYENRLAAVRIPAGPGAARRIEHRLAGADANPYLVLYAVLAAIADGLEAGARPPAPMSEAGALPADWGAAIAAFAETDHHPVLREQYLGVKRQEHRTFMSRLSAFEIDAYRDAV